MNTLNLLDCPFCGGTAEIDCQRGYCAISDGSIGSGVAIYCLSCNAEMMLCREDMPVCDTDELTSILVENWNKRAAAGMPLTKP